jgi:photosystem II stability/assembly factor-like uncharacterized protein
MAAPTVLAGSWQSGLFVYTSKTLYQELADQPVTGLARDGKGGVLAIVSGRTLRRRAPNGEWSTIATSASELSCCVAVGDAVYVGTADAHVLRVGPDGVLRQLGGFDAVAGREKWYAGTALVDGRVVGPPLGIRTITATCDGAVLLANVHVGGIPRSTDDGETWTPTVDIDSDVHQVCAHPARPDTVLAAAAVGLCVSKDGGASWTVEKDGLHAEYGSAVAFVGDDILVAASENHFAAHSAIYRRTLHGSGPLLPVGGGLPRWTDGIVDTSCITAHAASVAVVDQAGSLYLSEDAGHTWSRTLRVPSPSCLLIC